MTRSIVAFAVLCAIFGTTFAAIAVGIDAGWPPLLAAGARFTLAGAIVLALAAVRGELRRPARADALRVAFVGLTVTTATFAALYTAERVVPSGLAALASATSPAFAVVIALALGRRRFDRWLLAGLVFGTVGVALIVGVGGAALGPAVALGCLSIVVSEIAYAGGLTVTRDLAARLPILVIAGAQQTIGGLVLLTLSAAFEHALPARPFAGAGWLALAYLTVIASAGGHTLSIWLAGETSATFATSWSYIAPFIALAVGAV